jgi:hypothetical protein
MSGSRRNVDSSAGGNLRSSEALVPISNAVESLYHSPLRVIMTSAKGEHFVGTSRTQLQ